MIVWPIRKGKQELGMIARLLEAVALAMRCTAPRYPSMVKRVCPMMEACSQEYVLLHRSALTQCISCLI